MATTKSTTPRARTAKPRTTSRAKADESIVARTGRTLKQRPYTSAAIATGAVTAVVAAAAGAFFFSRRDKSFREASNELTTRVKDGLSDASDKIKNFAARGTGLFTGESGPKSQSEIAEEALTLKEIGKSKTKPVDELATTQTKVGAVAY